MAEGHQAFHLHTSGVRQEWRGNFGQDMLDKNVVLLETHLGTYRTSWELDGNTLGVKKTHKTSPPTQKKRNLAFLSMLSHLIGCEKFLC
jgi:hypothetical protein